MDETLIQDRGAAGTVTSVPHQPAPHDEAIRGGVHRPVPHDSAARHVSGAAVYIDDLPELPGTLHIYVAMSLRAHARIVFMDLSAVRQAPGVRCVLAAADIPGENDASPVFHDDPVFAEDEVQYVGQSLFAVAAETLDAARAASLLARVEYETCPLCSPLSRRSPPTRTFCLPIRWRSAMRMRPLPPRRTGSPGPCMSAGRTTSTWRAR
jgi:xanthine dehydrogenase large subunit